MHGRGKLPIVVSKCTEVIGINAFMQVLPRDKMMPKIFLGICYSYYRQNLDESKQNKKSKWLLHFLSHFTNILVEDTSNLSHELSLN